VLGAESNNELLVSLLLAALVEDAHVGLAAVESLGGLTETTGKTVVDQGDAQNTLEGVQDGHLAGTGIGRNLDLVGRGDGGCGLFSVRLGIVSSFLDFQVRREVINVGSGQRGLD
jgi:hypothetical protein